MSVYNLTVLNAGLVSRAISSDPHMRIHTSDAFCVQTCEGVYMLWQLKHFSSNLNSELRIWLFDSTCVEFKDPALSFQRLYSDSVVLMMECWCPQSRKSAETFSQTPTYWSLSADRQPAVCRGPDTMTREAGVCRPCVCVCNPETTAHNLLSIPISFLITC